MTFDDDHYHRVVQLYDEGEYALAADLARHHLQESPEDGRLWQIYGTACWNRRDFDSALEALEQATALVPLHPLAQLALAACYVCKGEQDLACVIYEHLGENVAGTEMLSTVAARLGALGRHEGALRVCCKITDLDPSHHQAFFGVAYYLSRLGNPPEALIPPLAMAMDLAPHIHHYRINLAFALAQAGRQDQAHELLKVVPLEAVRCPCWMRRMQAIFESVGDHARSLVCQVRLSCLLQ
jgi:Flp pilus assembly protein TadD